MPVTVGISKTRTLAKLISDSAKPFGARAILDDAAVTSLLASQPVTEIAGIAGKRQKRLAPWGIRTCLDLAQADRRLIRELLTATGEALWWELNGDPVLPLHPERPLHKVLSRGGSFGDPATSPVVLWAWLVRNLERLIEELEYHDVCVGKLTVWVAYKNGQAGVGTSRLAAPSQRFDILLDTARPCLRQGMGARGRRDTDAPVRGGSHLPTPCTARAVRTCRRGQTPIARLKRAINERHGRFVLRSGATLPLRRDLQGHGQRLRHLRHPGKNVLLNLCA